MTYAELVARISGNEKRLQYFGRFITREEFKTLYTVRCRL